MRKFTLFKAFERISEADEPAEAPASGPAGGATPPLPPPGLQDLSTPPSPGGMGLGDPGGMPGDAAAEKPLEINTISAGDCWKVLSDIVGDQKFDSFFDKIDINKKYAKDTIDYPQPRVSSFTR